MPGFFGPMPEWDEFLAQTMTPVMQDVGFKRINRMYRLTDQGSTVIVRADLFTPVPNVAFHIDWSVVPAFFDQLVREGRRSWRPSLRSGLIVARLTAPPELRPQIYAKKMWGYNDPAVPRIGGVPAIGLPLSEFAPLFQRHLLAEAIPKWKVSFTTDYLRTAYDMDEDLAYATYSGQYGGPHWMRAILAAHEGDPDDAKPAIDKMAALSPTAPIIPRLRELLHQRTSK